MSELLLGLVDNAALLLAMAVIFDMLALRQKAEVRPLEQLGTGLGLGLLGMAVMMNPWEFLPGVIFDTRSVLLGISGLFFGTIPALVAALMTGALRLSQGGSGAFPGVLVIFSSSIIGILWRHGRKGQLDSLTGRELYAFGLTIHVSMLLCMFTLPWPMPMSVLPQITLPVLVVLPTATWLLGLLLTRRLMRKQMAENLIESEKNLKEAQSIAQMGRWELNPKTNKLIWSDSIYELFDIEKTEFKQSYEDFFNKIHPDDRDLVEAAYESSVREKTPYTIEHRLIMKDGRIKWVHETGQTYYDEDGNALRTVGIVQDITTRKLAEDERKATIELLRLINSHNDHHELLNTLLIYLKNWSGCEAVGIRLNDGPDFPYYETSGFPQAFLQTENRLCRYNALGEPDRDFKGNPILECMCGNVLLGRFNPSLPFFTPHGSFWTNSTSKLLASTTESERQSRTRNRCHGSGYESVALIPLRSGNETLGLIQLNDKHKGRFTPEMIAQFERLGDNIAIFLAKKRVERDLKASQERFRALYEYSSVPIWEEDFSAVKAYFNELNAQGIYDMRAHFENHPEAVLRCFELIKILDVNHECLVFNGADQKEQLTTRIKIDSENIAVEPGLQEEIIALAEGRTEFECELPVRTLRGEDKFASMHLSVVPGCETNLEQVLVSFWDITERRQAEEKLRQTLAEKETLIRELYHRTKNNMQVISSMMALQEEYLDDPLAITMFEEMRNRIVTMAMVHQKLYQSHNLSYIELGEYLRELTEMLIQSYKVSNSPIGVVTETDTIPTLIDTAIPCGLILNELVSNALKYAFPHGQAGQISLVLKKDGTDIIMCLSDNGVGLPEGFDLNQRSKLGLQIVTILGENQLQGEMEIKSDHGFSFHLRFPATLYTERV